MIKLDILTPEWTRSVEAEAVFVPGVLGEFEVLQNHAPIISALVAGDVKWREGGKLEKIAVKGGVMRLKDNEMKVCAEI